MLFSQFKQLRLSELIAEQWGAERIPDLMEVLSVANPRSVLEIGCYQGVSTEFWLLHCERVYAIDPWRDHTVRANFLRRAGHYPNLTRIEGFSPDILYRLPSGVFFDMVYIDGDHSYEGAKADICGTWKHVKVGGWIAGHDYTDTPAPGDDVKRAVDEILGPPQYRCSDGSWLVQKERVIL